MKKILSEFVQIVVLILIFALCWQASRFRFDNLWPTLVAILSAIGALAGLLLGYTSLTDDPADRALLKKAARDCIWATIMMSAGVSLLAAYYVIFVIIFHFAPDPTEKIAPASGWGALGFVPALPMMVASAWTISAMKVFLTYAVRSSASERAAAPATGPAKTDKR